jgi:hypothetical protein
MINNNFGFELIEESKVEFYKKVDEKNRVEIRLYIKYIESKVDVCSVYISDIDDENKSKAYPIEFNFTPEDDEMNTIFAYACSRLVEEFKIRFGD